MALSVGIVGLPNVGKSTLFNALLSKQQALAANYPFATIEPNVGVVPVPDDRLQALASVIQKNTSTNPPIAPATINFVDIAGLVKGASEGEGLGNQFLANIRETDVIVHVLRDFEDTDIVREGSVDPLSDLEIIRTELILKDLETLEKQKQIKGTVSKEEEARWSAVLKLKTALQEGQMANQVSLTDAEAEAVSQLFLLTAKPELFAINVSESGPFNGQKYADMLSIPEQQIVVLCARMEAEMVDLDTQEKSEYLETVGLESSGLERLISAAYTTLGLSSFLTAGEKEVRAWTIRNDMTAPQAAGVIHTDFQHKFIKAKTVSFSDFIQYSGWKAAAEAGKVRMEGKDYLVKDGDVIEFMVGS